MGNFEFDGEKYKQASKHQKEWGNALIASLGLKGNESILDLGCGDGVLTKQLAMLVPDGDVLGADASKGMIHTAEKLAGENLRFVCLDIEQMDFDSQFDVIFSNAALHWVKDHKKLLNNCLKALDPHGYIAWNFAADGTAETFNSTAREVMELPAFTEFFECFEWPWYMPKECDYRELVSAAGFHTYTITEENRDRYFENSGDLIKWIDQPSIVPFLQQLPEAKKEAFRQRVVDGMLEKALLPDGRCFETFRRMHVVAYK